MSDATTTTNHRVIRAWVEARGGRPCRSDSDGGAGLRIDFGRGEHAPDQIPWDAFFVMFEGRGLAFLHQDLAEDGTVSQRHDFVPRDGA